MHLGRGDYTISLTREEVWELLIDGYRLFPDGTSTERGGVSDLLHMIDASLSDFEKDELRREIRRRHNIMHLGAIKPGAAA